MFRSLRTKFVILIVSILLVTGSVVMFFTEKDVGKAMMDAEEHSVRNVLELVDLNIHGGYKTLLTDKVDSVERRKEQMKSAAAIVVKGIETYYDLFRRGTLSEDEARKLALDWVDTVRYGDKGGFFIYDKNYIALCHPDAHMHGADLSGFKDIKERHVMVSMREEAMNQGDAYAMYFWKVPDAGEPIKKLGYFLYYRNWDWVIGTDVDIGDIERTAEKKLNDLIAVLRSSFNEIRIARSGSLFLFNGKKDILIYPEGPGRESPDYLRTADPQTGKSLLDELMTAAKEKRRQPLLYVPAEANGRAKELYVSYVKVLDWYVASAAYVDEINAPAHALVMRQLLMISVIFVVSLAVALIMVGRISSPLKRLTGYAKELSSRDFTQSPTAESPIKDLPDNYHDEVGRLAESIIFMEEELQKNIQELMAATAARERMDQELKIARHIQMSILPKTFPPFPTREELEVFAAIEPAREVGGDLYDFFFIDDDHFCFVIGDVSGKGVPASLFMAVTKTLIKAAAAKTQDAAAILTSVNNDLCPDNDTCMFVTLFCGILNVRTGEVTYANGGHNPPILVRKRGGVAYQTGKGGTIVGAMEDIFYPSDKMTLNPGDSLFLYTDGVTEAMNPDHELFSDKRLLEHVIAKKDQSIQSVVEELMFEVKRFAAEAPQSDDITVMILKYKGCGTH